MRKEVVAVFVVYECRPCILVRYGGISRKACQGNMFGPGFGASTFQLNVRKPVL